MDKQKNPNPSDKSGQVKQPDLSKKTEPDNSKKQSDFDQKKPLKNQ